MVMADFQPTTEAGKKAIADGADPTVVAEMEQDGSLSDVKEETPAEHIDTKTPQPDDKGDKGPGKKEGADDGNGGKKDGDGNGADDSDKGPNRTPKSLPIWKHKEELKNLRDQLTTEFEQKIQDLASKKGGASDTDVHKFAEEFGLTDENAGAMIDRMTGILETRLGISEIRTNEQQRQERDKETQEQQGFAKEWTDKTTQDAITAAANGRQLPSDIQEKVRELAYSTTYARYRLSDIIRLNEATLFPKEVKNTPARTAETGSRGASQGQARKSIEEMTPEEIDGMSDEDFQALSNELGGKGSRFTRTTKPPRTQGK